MHICGKHNTGVLLNGKKLRKKAQDKMLFNHSGVLKPLRSNLKKKHMTESILARCTCVKCTCVFCFFNR